MLTPPNRKTHTRMTLLGLVQIRRAAAVGQIGVGRCPVAATPSRLRSRCRWRNTELVAGADGALAAERRRSRSRTRATAALRSESDSGDGARDVSLAAAAA
jgi:hypothetical protein